MLVFLLTLLVLSLKAPKPRKAIALAGALWLYAVQGIIIFLETAKQIGLPQNNMLQRGEHGESLLSGGIDILIRQICPFTCKGLCRRLFIVRRYRTVTIETVSREKKD